MSKKKKYQMLERVATPEQAMPAQELVEFDAWWAVKSRELPKHHRKEVIRADFTARGLNSSEPKEAYEAALKKYGL